MTIGEVPSGPSHRSDHDQPSDLLQLTLVQLRGREYDLRRRVEVLRRAAYGDQPRQEPAADEWSAAALDDLARLETELAQTSAARLEAERGDDAGVVLKTATQRRTLGVQSTGLEATVLLRMEYLPTAIIHLLEAGTHPLVTVRVRRAAGEQGIRRVRVTAAIDGYSVPAVDSVELSTGKEEELKLLPTFQPAALATVTELTRATLSILVEDLDNQRVEVHRTSPVWLLARNSAPLSVGDPAGGTRVDLTPYLAAFVTPNAPAVVDFLAKVAARHPERQLVGYQGSPDVVMPQVKALYEALAADARITYINSVITFEPEQGAASQRVRLPRESLAGGAANCLDGALLYASLLEAMSLRPAIVLVPGHALVAWEAWPDSDQWHHLETTKTRFKPFETACRLGEALADRFDLDKQPGGPPQYRRLPLRSLRVDQRITPME